MSFCLANSKSSDATTLLSRSKRSCSGVSLIGFSKVPSTGTTPLLPKVGHPLLQVAGINAGMRPTGYESRTKKPCQSSPPASFERRFRSPH